MVSWRNSNQGHVFRLMRLQYSSAIRQEERLFLSGELSSDYRTYTSSVGMGFPKPFKMIRLGYDRAQMNSTTRRLDQISSSRHSGRSGRYEPEASFRPFFAFTHPSEDKDVASGVSCSAMQDSLWHELAGKNANDCKAAAKFSRFLFSFFLPGVRNKFYA